MDVAYDHIQEEALSPSPSRERKPSAPTEPSASSTTAEDNANTSAPQDAQSDLNSEFQAAFKAVQSSPWGTTLGSWFSTARRQGESFYQDLQKEATEAGEQATKGFSSLREQVVNRTRSLSLGGEAAPESGVPGEEAVPVASTARGKEGDASVGAGAAAEAEALANQTESLPADIVKEAGSLVASLRSTAASKLKDLQRAEDAADEALLKFGTNVRNFLRDAVVITAPDAEKDGKGSEVLFETSEPGTGKKVFHSTRLDAQLHAIHTTTSSFTEDPAQGEAWEEWSGEFDIDSKTKDIAADLDKHEELRRAMEKLVPEKVEYKAFWTRYYFLRSAVEEDERKRREVLKGRSLHLPLCTTFHSSILTSLIAGASTTEDEDIAWDDDDEQDDNTPTPNKAAASSTTTLSAPTQPAASADNGLLKPKSPRRSHEDESKSVADSDASYDIVSGATSRATGSPREKRKEEDSDDDWE